MFNGAGAFLRTLFIKMPLDGLNTCGGFGFSFIEAPGANGWASAVQGTKTQMYFGSHKGTNNSMGELRVQVGSLERKAGGQRQARPQGVGGLRKASKAPPRTPCKALRQRLGDAELGECGEPLGDCARRTWRVARGRVNLRPQHVRQRKAATILGASREGLASGRVPLRCLHVAAIERKQR